jgi:hypothetical protein
MTLEDLKAEAILAASEIGINWESLDDIKERNLFEKMVARGNAIVPDLEFIYTKLTNGKSVSASDEDTPLNSEEVEKYTELISEELFNGYILQELYSKYTTIESILRANENNPHGIDKGDPNQLNLFENL